MKIILVMVSSADGKTTRGEESSIYQWTSKEDSEYFFTLLQKQQLLIMGRNTYEAARSMIKLSPQTLRIVITSRPEEFATQEVKGQLEFSSELPKQLVARLEKQGYTAALLIGGATTNGSFLKEGLLSEIWVTLEPKLLGKGNSLIKTENSYNRDLRLLSSEKLNPQGTLLLKYTLV